MQSIHSRDNDLVEGMIERMEQYTKNLEGLVEERTKEFLEEKKKVPFYYLDLKRLYTYCCPFSNFEKRFL